MSASLLFNSDDDGTQDAVGDLEDTIKLSRHFGRYFAGHVDVVALNQVVDRVRKTALAPLVNTGQSAVSLHDTLEFFHESRDTLFTLRGIDDIEDLILCGIFAIPFAPLISHSPSSESLIAFPFEIAK